MGTNIFSGSDHPETISAIKIKFRTIDYVGEGNPQPIFGNNRIIGGFSPYGWNVTFRRSAFWTDFNEQYLKTRVSGETAYLWVRSMTS